LGIKTRQSDLSGWRVFTFSFKKMQNTWQPTLEDAQIRLEPLLETDREALFQVAADPLIWDQHPARRYERAVFDRYFDDSMASGGALVIRLKNTHEIIGSSRFNRVETTPRAVEIGWTFLARAHWGGPTNLRVKTLMIDHAFGVGGFEWVVFRVASINFRSQAAVQKLGARLIDPTTTPELADARADYLTFLLTRHDWGHPTR
jgi:N-acetyltransferase